MVLQIQPRTACHPFFTITGALTQDCAAITACGTGAAVAANASGTASAGRDGDITASS